MAKKKGRKQKKVEKAEAKGTEVKSETKPETKPEVKPEIESEIESEAKAEMVSSKEEVEEAEKVAEVAEVKPKLDPELKRLMRVRIRQKSRKPEFKRYESHKKLRLRNKSWRRPRGMDNKMRKRIAGKRPVSVGFGTPSAVRNLHPSGFREVLVTNPTQLEGIDAEREAVRVASSVGLKKRLAIEDKAKELGIRILNPLRVS
jgi:large subunit ribosomal protein L32e